MSDDEMITASNYVRCDDVIRALITIKRGIYSKPVKAYINTLIADIKSRALLKPVQENCYQSAMSYHLAQETALYGQKKWHSVDVIC